jgi:putative nucleotidyltransferase with HDIG domain
MKSKNSGKSTASPADVVERTAAYVRSRLEGESSGHDWWHTYRVWRGALYIGQREKVDLLTIQLAALLHDIGRSRTQGMAHAVEGARIAQNLGLPQEVVAIIERHLGAGLTPTSAPSSGSSRGTACP